MAQQSFELTGNLYTRQATVTKTGSNGNPFSYRNFSIKIENQHNPAYPNFVPFQLTQDRCDLIRGYNKGDLIKVHFNIEGREWNDRILANNKAWKIELIQAAAVAPPPPPKPQPVADDDLPF